MAKYGQKSFRRGESAALYLFARLVAVHHLVHFLQDGFRAVAVGRFTMQNPYADLAKGAGSVVIPAAAIAQIVHNAFGNNAPAKGDEFIPAKAIHFPMARENTRADVGKMPQIGVPQ